LNKAPLKPIASRSAADLPAFDADQEDSDDGSQAEEEDYLPAKFTKSAREDRPEKIGSAREAEHFWTTTRQRLANLHLNLGRFAEPVDVKQLQRSVQLFRATMSAPNQQRAVCCVCGEYKPASQVHTLRLPGSSKLDNVVRMPYLTGSVLDVAA